MMDIPSATFSSEIAFEDGHALVTREVDFGLQQIRVALPYIFTCDLRLNTPRFANVKSILKAKKKKVEVIKLTDLLDIDVTPRLTIESVEAPSEREGGVIVDSVDELLEKLRNEAKVI
jgi:electron transfer flavoprotein beta subunit